MSNLSGVTNFFSTANEGFSTTLSTTISSGATTVPLSNMSALTDGSVFVGIIEPGGINQQTFTGTVSQSSTAITGVIWTRGTNVAHVAGVTVVDFVTGTDFNMMSAGMLKQHTQAGAHKGITNTSGMTNTGGLTTDTLTTSGDTTHNGNLTVASGKTITADSPGLVPLGGAWRTWTPTETNMTIGNGTYGAYYIQIGKTIICRFHFVLGTTSSIGNSVSWTLPVTATSNHLFNYTMVGNSQMSNGSTVSAGGVRLVDTTHFMIEGYRSDGTFLSTSWMGVGSPFGWVAASNNVMGCTFTYEAA